MQPPNDTGHDQRNPAATKTSSTDATTATSSAPSPASSTPPRELIEDACQNAWAILLRNQPERGTIFAWLRVVAIHEAYRLSAIERRDAHLEATRPTVASWEEVIADQVAIDDALEAREALRVLAELPARQRHDLTLFVAGYSYREIARRSPAAARTPTSTSTSSRRAPTSDGRDHCNA